MSNDFVIMWLYAPVGGQQKKNLLFLCVSLLLCGFLCMYMGLLWSPVCSYDLLMNLFYAHLCCNDTGMFNYKVE